MIILNFWSFFIIYKYSDCYLIILISCKNYDLFFGIDEALGIILIMTPRTVSITKVKGVAYIFTKDFVSSKVSPQIIPPQKAAPNATVSSGFFSLGFF
jgi:hypothetical protein